MALAAIGYRALSMSAAALGPVKAMVRGLDVGRLSARLQPRLETPGALDDPRALLRAFAAENDIPL